MKTIQRLSWSSWSWSWCDHHNRIQIPMHPLQDEQCQSETAGSGMLRYSDTVDGRNLTNQLRHKTLFEMGYIRYGSYISAILFRAICWALFGESVLNSDLEFRARNYNKLTRFLNSQWISFIKGIIKMLMDTETPNLMKLIQLQTNARWYGITLHHLTA